MLVLALTRDSRVPLSPRARVLAQAGHGELNDSTAPCEMWDWHVVLPSGLGRLLKK